MNNRKEKEYREGCYVDIYSCLLASGGPNHELRIVDKRTSNSLPLPASSLIIALSLANMVNSCANKESIGFNELPERVPDIVNRHPLTAK